jgi:hypothetical protein
MFAIDLSNRQSARTLEQAIRHETDILLQPRHRPDNPPIHGQLFDCPTLQDKQKDSRFITVAICHNAEVTEGSEANPASEAEDAERHLEQQGRAYNWDYRELLGVYCDASLLLGEHRYFFSTDVVGVETDAQPDGNTFLTLSRPEQIQVAQRRRYRRINLAHSTQVSLQWKGEQDEANYGIGWLCNISQDGLACRTESPTADRLCIGEPLHVEFNLGGGEEMHYTIKAMLCSKTPAGSQGKIILGMQFLANEENDASYRSIQALKVQLAQWYTKQPGNQKRA